MLILLMGLLGCVIHGESNISVGSKAFTEGYILGELLSQKIEDAGKVKVKRRLGMGGTGILIEALLNNEIQLYVEYTGTISEAIIKDPSIRSFEALEKRLSSLHLVMSKPLGFNNTYALALRQSVSEEKGIQKISDLSPWADKLRVSFSHEFMTREDGFRKLSDTYKLKFGSNVVPLAHGLAYEAIENEQADLIDVYTTDAKIEKLKLKVLRDDLRFFPEYQAVILARSSFIQTYPEIWNDLATLSGSINEEMMIKLNSMVDVEKKSFADAARSFLGKSGSEATSLETVSSRILRRTKEHILLVGLSLLFSILAGVPLGILASRSPILEQIILVGSGMVQTIPSLALLCFLIPVFGIGTKPALVALFLYGLLPVVLNTFIGIKNIDFRLIETAKALGLHAWQRLFLVELPLASRNILAGVKTSAIIGIGTATLAALIGAGGYGVPIISGLSVNDINTILIGAVPAACLALVTHGVFYFIELLIIPRGLR